MFIFAMYQNYPLALTPKFMPKGNNDNNNNNS